MKLLPFSNLNDYEFCDELTFALAENATPTANVPTIDSSSRPVASSKVDVHETDVRNNIVDSFNHVYCDYIGQNDVPDLMSTVDPSCISIFHSNVISLRRKFK